MSARKEGNPFFKATNQIRFWPCCRSEAAVIPDGAEPATAPPTAAGAASTTAAVAAAAARVTPLMPHLVVV